MDLAGDDRVRATWCRTSRTDLVSADLVALMRWRAI
jgi:hypothetical protein